MSTVVSLVACGGGGGSSSHAVPIVTVTPTATPPTPVPSGSSSFDAAAFVCPSSDAQTSVARTGGVRLGGEHVLHQGARRLARTAAAATSSGLLAVTYSGVATTGSRGALTAVESAHGAALVRELDLGGANKTVRYVSVAPGTAQTAAAALRTQSGVQSVQIVTEKRHASSVSTPYYSNDPYFQGFTAAQNAAAQNAQPSTFETPPYAESANVPGQWNMHAVGLEHAFGYSQPNNGSGITNPAALGSANVKLAIIDTGEDTTHPELAGKVVRQGCFISNPDNVQSTSSFSTDPDGHGTDVSGIAVASTNNAFGFASTGGNTSLMAYRVYPTPDDSCTSDTSTSQQCVASTVDIASAITDAVNNGASVISMSLGGGNCSSPGVDSDAGEGAAIANAIAHNVVVVVAAGNDGTSTLEAPACDAGVIAVGASALADGSTIADGANNGLGSANTPIEYVASYSNYGSPGASVRSTSAWGIVAPGGDPGSTETGTDPNTVIDNLHWIEDIWTTKPFMAAEIAAPGASPTPDASFAGICSPDYTSNGSTDCRILIAGTSMATPHVAGAAALIIAANPSYATPAKMRALLCSTADDIQDPHEGCGRLNVYRAMATALGDTNLP